MSVPFTVRADCWLGFTRSQVEQLMAERIVDFDEWMHGRTGGICDGRTYDYDLGGAHDTECGPHGRVVYPHDLTRYLATHPATAETPDTKEGK